MGDPFALGVGNPYGITIVSSPLVYATICIMIMSLYRYSDTTLHEIHWNCKAMSSLLDLLFGTTGGNSIRVTPMV